MTCCVCQTVQTPKTIQFTITLNSNIKAGTWRLFSIWECIYSSTHKSYEQGKFTLSWLPAEHLWMDVHDIQRLFEAAILNKANYFTGKGRHIVSVFVQNWDKRRHTHIAKSSLVMQIKRENITTENRIIQRRIKQSVNFSTDLVKAD